MNFTFTITNEKTGSVEKNKTTEQVANILKDAEANVELIHLRDNNSSVYENPLWKERYVVECTKGDSQLAFVELAKKL